MAKNKIIRGVVIALLVVATAYIYQQRIAFASYTSPINYVSFTYPKSWKVDVSDPYRIKLYSPERPAQAVANPYIGDLPNMIVHIDYIDENVKDIKSYEDLGKMLTTGEYSALPFEKVMLGKIPGYKPIYKGLDGAARYGGTPQKRFVSNGTEYFLYGNKSIVTVYVEFARFGGDSQKLIEEKQAILDSLRFAR
jgi:hypothetical protein